MAHGKREGFVEVMVRPGGVEVPGSYEPFGSSRFAYFIHLIHPYWQFLHLGMARVQEGENAGKEFNGQIVYSSHFFFLETKQFQ